MSQQRSSGNSYSAGVASAPGRQADRLGGPPGGSRYGNNLVPLGGSKVLSLPLHGTLAAISLLPLCSCVTRNTLQGSASLVHPGAVRLSQTEYACPCTARRALYYRQSGIYPLADPAALALGAQLSLCVQRPRPVGTSSGKLAVPKPVNLPSLRKARLPCSLHSHLASLAQLRGTAAATPPVSCGTSRSTCLCAGKFWERPQHPACACRRRVQRQLAED